MKYRPIFIMGTSSGAGKTTVVTALCRIFSDMGIDVVPFKAQNMSLNAGVGIGGEMAYAQVIQAKACRKTPDVKMNPILLKPEDGKTQVIVNGKFFKTIDAKNYMSSNKEDLFNVILRDFKYIQDRSELVIIEGAGSPAEINIRYDVANMQLARKIGSKNILVSDIDRGGSFASIVGTVELLGKNSFSGYIMNKFRGSEDLLENGYYFLFKNYNLKHYGTIPFIDNNLPQEDSLWSWNGKNGKIRISIIKLPHISNATDFHIFSRIKDVGFNFASNPDELNNADAIIIPGTKLTVQDLFFIRKEGFEDKINELYKEGAKIIGICGGYQMLGKYIIDNFETKSGKINGLGILDSRTKFDGRKIVSLISGKILAKEFMNYRISGYQIHFGKSISRRPFSLITKEYDKDVIKYDGSVSERALGTYFHDVFYNINFLKKFLNDIAKEKGLEKINVNYNIDKEIEMLAKLIKKHIDADSILNE
ncbi:MAG: cobyric acid synthase [Thermoplasmata archaeon]